MTFTNDNISQVFSHYIVAPDRKKRKYCFIFARVV